MSDEIKHPALSPTGLLGLIAPLIALVCIAIAISLAPFWTWDGNALSDLGHWFRTDIGPNPSIRAFVFCFGLVTTGVLMFYFTVWFFRKLNDTITKIGLLPFFSAIIFLILIGVIAENFEGHYEVSVGFFFSFPWAMWIVGLGLFRYKHLWWFAMISMILPFFCIYMWTGWYGGLFPFWTGNAIPEILTAMTAIAWLWIMWFLFYKNKLDPILSP